jgi:hypothetical protein
MMFPRNSRIEDFDPELAKAIANENRRQEDHVELIASENYASPRVMEAQGSQLTNKYAEGYPGKRYYGGCEFVDIAERLAIERCKELFGADYANVQPHSGSQANQAVYFALLEPGDRILGMSLAHGGHLTHGAKVNLSGKIFDAVQYGVDAAGLIDYDEVERLALEHRPKMVVAGFSAYSQVVDWARFRAIADKVGAYLFVDMAHVAGLEQRQVHRLVGLRTRMRLHVGIVGREQLAATFDRQPFGHVDEFAATVVALARVALGVLVGQHAALGLHHPRAGVVLAGDQLDVVFLAPALVGDRLGKFGVVAFDAGVAREHAGLLRSVGDRVVRSPRL